MGDDGADGASDFSDFFIETRRWAADRVPALRAARLIGTDLSGQNGSDYTLIGTAAPAVDDTKSGGVYTLPGGTGYGEINLGGQIIDGVSSFRKLIASPKTEPWAARALLWANMTTFQVNNVFPLMIGNNVSEYIYIISIPGSSDVTPFFSLFSGGADHPTSCGSVGTLGSATFPALAWFPLGFYFDGENLGVEFSDTPCFAPLHGSDLNFMGTSAMGVSVAATDEAFGLRCDALALVVL